MTEQQVLQIIGIDSLPTRESIGRELGPDGFYLPSGYCHYWNPEGTIHVMIPAHVVKHLQENPEANDLEIYTMDIEYTDGRVNHKDYSIVRNSVDC